MAAAENVSEDGAAALPIKEAIPSILDGTFFKIAKVDEGGKVLAKCCNCVNNSISGTFNTTSNFLRHLKVCRLCFGMRPHFPLLFNNHYGNLRSTGRYSVS